MSEGTEVSTRPAHLRIFLASPGDVADERGLAQQVIEGLQYDPFLRDRVTLETVAWDQPGGGTPMLATMTPQAAIEAGLPRPSECDIVVVVLWSRLGTPLPPEQRKPHGPPHQSGTVWEYLDALERADDLEPQVLVYRRTEKAQVDLDDPNLEAKREQLRLVEEFFDSFENPDGTIARGYNPYESPDDFRRDLEHHLRDRIHHLLESQTPEPIGEPDEETTRPALELWEGSPFPGLRPFGKADAPIFFGRGRETDGLVKALAGSATRFLAVVGASGSGKSSLVAAGLLPRLEANAVAGSRDWRVARFTPGEYGEDPFVALAASLNALVDSPALRPGDLADRLRSKPAQLVEEAELVLADDPDWAELLLVVDQFEELFTTVKQDSRNAFIEMLVAAASSCRIRTVVTVRADFYNRCVEHRGLAELLRAGTYSLAAPGPGALLEMLTGPAHRAGLEFEEGLVTQILDETGDEPGKLALMSFALSELYEAAKDDGHLTQAAYRTFGGVTGAIGQRAEAVFESLSSTEKQATRKALLKMVSVSEGTEAVTRRRARLAELSEPGRAVVRKLADSRLVVIGRDEATGTETVEVAHEALIGHWKRLRDWVNEDREFLLWQERLGTARAEWQRNGKNPDDLLRDRRLVEAEARVHERGEELSDDQRSFIRASMRRRRARRVRAGLVGATVLALVALGGRAILEYQERLADRTRQETTFVAEIDRNVEESFQALVALVKRHGYQTSDIVNALGDEPRDLGGRFFAEGPSFDDVVDDESARDILDAIEQAHPAFVDSRIAFGGMVYAVDEVTYRSDNLTLRTRAGDLRETIRDSFIEAHEEIEALPSNPRADEANPAVRLEGASFLMGGGEDQHRVTVSSFWMQEHEVSNAEYRRFDPERGDDHLPVVYVNWYEAYAYAAWLGGSLPTEAQWEFAARGRDGREYPWGDETPTCDRANYSDCNDRFVAVKSYDAGATPEGIYDLAGNVWEWCRDWYGPYSATEQTDPPGPPSGPARVLRGGSFVSAPGRLRAANRGSGPDNRGGSYGFRVAWASSGGLD